MGLELIKGPVGSQTDAGIFNLPIGFDLRQHAAQWVAKDDVANKQQRQPVVGTQYSAEGWEIWRKDTKDKPTEVSVSGNKVFVLMCRSRTTQDAVNAEYGNVSKRSINQEIQGQTIQGKEIVDPGMIPESQIKKIQGSIGDNTGEMSLNEIFNSEPAAVAET